MGFEFTYIVIETTNDSLEGDDTKTEFSAF